MFVEPIEFLYMLLHFFFFFKAAGVGPSPFRPPLAPSETTFINQGETCSSLQSQVSISTSTTSPKENEEPLSLFVSNLHLTRRL